MTPSKNISLYERALRRFSSATHLITLIPFYLLCVLCIGTAAAPGLVVFAQIERLSAGLGSLAGSEGALALAGRAVALGCGLGLGYLAYGLSLIFVVPLANWLLRCRLQPWRGPYYSNKTVKWTVHNGLTYIVRFTFLEFITPTPLNILFFRLMGMKIGAHVHVNSSAISDPSLISIGDRVTIGGSATIIGHYGVGGLLVLAPTTIAKGATIGLRAIVMGGSTIGENAKVLPNSVILPKTRVGDGETWGGVPAAKMEPPKRAAGEAPVALTPV
jgi:serine acetyltransferase